MYKGNIINTAVRKISKKSPVMTKVLPASLEKKILYLLIIEFKKKSFKKGWDA